MSGILPLVLTDSKMVRGASGLVEELEERFLDMEREFIVEAAKFLGREDIIELWTTDPLGAVEELRAALDGAAESALKGARSAFSEKYGDFISLQTSRIDRFGRAAVEAGIKDAVTAPPIIGASKAAALVERGYKDVWDVVDRVFMTVRQDVVWGLEKALTDVTTGGVSITRAIDECMTDLAVNGVKGHVYPSGRSISLSPYVRRELVTNMMNVTNELAFERAKDWGTKLIQVSAHAGARPKCFPWQGGVYAVKGERHEKYKSLEDTSYGDPGGLFGVNCRHFSWPFFEGLNDEYTEEQKDPARLLRGPSNDEVYEATQEQRRNERQIRAWKRRRAELAAQGADTSAADMRIRAWQARQRALIVRSEADRISLRRDYQREKS